MIAGVGVDNMEVDPVEATAPAPVVEMSLLADASRQAEFVNIGDPWVFKCVTRFEI